ncbi:MULTISPECIES: type II toxin-antitoxin system HicA family toxin [Candidatus Korarchaeia]|nr:MULTISPECIES: type II toxin-antitoxin system HicA family toxin [Candidatus Korarchaeota]
MKGCHLFLGSCKGTKQSSFKVVHQRGSHMYLTDGKHKITVPKHDPIKRGTLLSIIYQSGLTKEEFFEAAKGVIDSVSALKKLRS